MRMPLSAGARVGPSTETGTDHTDSGDVQATGPALPALVLVYAADAPRAQVFPLGPRGPLVFGRDSTALIAPDPLMSRAHAEVYFRDGLWTVRDLESRNGTFVDGEPVRGTKSASTGAVLRLAKTLFLLVDDARPFRAGLGGDDDIVSGPSMRAILGRVAQSAAAGRDLLVTGETGTGKEVVARAFHAASRRASTPMVSVNCAALPEGLAERLLFGARRGAYSGATTDGEGLLAEADGSVLFLDEVGELDVRVQAKLLRFLETREIMPLGATRCRKVDVQIVFATHCDLWKEVEAGRMREDFMQRIVRPHLELPPLRARREEIPWLIARELRMDDRGLLAHVKLIEAALQYDWPGNVRALTRAMRAAADAALFEGSPLVRVEHVPELQGVLDGEDSRVAAVASSGEEHAPVSRVEPDARELAEALAAHAGNVAATARVLGLHRRHLYRLLARYGLTRGSA